MNKYLLVVLMILGLCSCSVKDARYYRMNPKALQMAIKSCPEQQPKHVTCQELEEIASHFNALAHKLQYNPQNFGVTILKLQETIAEQQEQVQKNAADTQLQADLQKNKKELAEHMAIVKWLESPES